MGNAAELCARECNVSREAQDAFAIESYRRAQAAQKNGAFAVEIVPVEIAGKKGDVVKVTDDEDPTKTNFDKIPTLRPAFQKDGTVTAANASKVSDGAAAMVVMSADAAARLHVRHQVRVLRQASAAKAPEWFTTAPADAIAKVLARHGLSVGDIDLFEVNEAFAVVALAVGTLAKLDPATVNIHGGAIALGHPLGASGARILVTLIHAMERLNKKRGLATLCIGGGEASAVIVERPS
jgi:acetyl-CoA C-acetyltransferase